MKEQVKEILARRYEATDDSSHKYNEETAQELCDLFLKGEKPTRVDAVFCQVNETPDKLEGEKPPVLSDEEIYEADQKVMPLNMHKENDEVIREHWYKERRVIAKAQYDALLPYIQQEGQESKDVLEAARAAILDAIYCEDGLDGGAGKAVMDWITDILGDKEEYHPIIEGISSQTENFKAQAIEYQEKLVRREVADKIFGEIRKLWQPAHHNLCYGVIKPHPDCIACKLEALKNKER